MRRVHRLLVRDDRLVRYDRLRQWYKPRYKTGRQDAVTYTAAQVRVYAQERGLPVAESLLTRRIKHG
jgi:hypothetical protein